jgi:hypothetical protein
MIKNFKVRRWSKQKCFKRGHRRHGLTRTVHRWIYGVASDPWLGGGAVNPWRGDQCFQQEVRGRVLLLRESWWSPATAYGAPLLPGGEEILSNGWVRMRQ